MKSSAALRKEADAGDCWKGFRPGDWSTSINVRDFIVRNVTPFPGNEDFLAGASRRTTAVWAKLQPYFVDERKKGVLAVDAQTPSTVVAHKAGYIDRDNEVIVGLQTDQPFKRAIFPFGGLRMVEGTAGNLAVRRFLNERKVPQLFVASGDEELSDPNAFPWTMGWQPSFRAEGRIHANYIQAFYSQSKTSLGGTS